MENDKHLFFFPTMYVTSKLASVYGRKKGTCSDRSLVHLTLFYDSVCVLHENATQLRDKEAY